MLLSFLYLYWRGREQYLLLWAVAAGVWSMRYIFGLATVGSGLSWLSAVWIGLAVIRGGFMFWGVRAKTEPGVPAVAIGVGSVLLTVLILWPAVVEVTPAAMLFYGYLAWSMILSGMVFGLDESLPLVERNWTAAAFVALGLLQVAFPLAGDVTAFAPVGFALAAALQLGIAFGVMMTFFRRSVEEARRVAQEEEMALTRALSDFVSICAHCKRIQDGEAWEDLQDYVTDRTAAEVTDALCPNCLQASR